MRRASSASLALREHNPKHRLLAVLGRALSLYLSEIVSTTVERP